MNIRENMPPLLPMELQERIITASNAGKIIKIQLVM